MWKNNEIFRESIKSALNHKARAQEGKKLLEEGRSIGEMSIQPEGLTEDQILERRLEYLAFLDSKKPEDLSKLLRIIEFQIEKRLASEEQGTSELYWQRIVIKDRLEE